jgi:hypothetical protein
MILHHPNRLHESIASVITDSMVFLLLEKTIAFVKVDTFAAFPRKACEPPGALFDGSQNHRFYR